MGSTLFVCIITTVEGKLCAYVYIYEFHENYTILGVDTEAYL